MRYSREAVNVVFCDKYDIGDDRMNRAYAQVKAFHQAFGAPVGEVPAQLSPDRVAKRTAWLQEEVQEFVDAGDLCAQADAMIDLIYFALGSMVEMGVQPEALFDIVHQANMDKLWPDGKPHYGQDTKVIKPHTWRAPDEAMRAEIARQAAGK